MSRSLATPANTLLEGSLSRETTQSAVFDVLSRPDATNLLVLSYRDNPDAWLQDWHATVGDLPEELGFVHVGAETRSTSAAPSVRIPTSPSPVSSSDSKTGPDTVPLADAVSDPTDLARLGVYASEYLETWDGNGRETVVYLDSLTDMLKHAALPRVFSFLHVLAGRVESVDGRCFCLLDPTAHDDRSVVVVRELADAVVDVAAEESA